MPRGGRILLAGRDGGGSRVAHARRARLCLRWRGPVVPAWLHQHGCLQGSRLAHAAPGLKLTQLLAHVSAAVSRECSRAITSPAMLLATWELMNGRTGSVRASSAFFSLHTTWGGGGGITLEDSFHTQMNFEYNILLNNLLTFQAFKRVA